MQTKRGFAVVREPYANTKDRPSSIPVLRVNTVWIGDILYLVFIQLLTNCISEVGKMVCQHLSASVSYKALQFSQRHHGFKIGGNALSNQLICKIVSGLHKPCPFTWLYFARYGFQYL